MVHIHIKWDGYNIFLKIMWIILSLIELDIICKCIPNRKINIISNVGANTLNIYLLHSLIAKWIRLNCNDIFIYSEITNIAIMLILTCILLLVFGNKFVKKMMIYLTDFNNLKGLIKCQKELK